MSDLEDLLREELKRTAQKVQPEVLRPLRVPASGHGWRPHLLPLAVAAAVIVIIAVVALITGLPASHQPAEQPELPLPDGEGARRLEHHGHAAEARIVQESAERGPQSVGQDQS